MSCRTGRSSASSTVQVQRHRLRLESQLPLDQQQLRRKRQGPAVRPQRQPPFGVCHSTSEWRRLRDRLGPRRRHTLAARGIRHRGQDLPVLNERSSASNTDGSRTRRVDSRCRVPSRWRAKVYVAPQWQLPGYADRQLERRDAQSPAGHRVRQQPGQHDHPGRRLPGNRARRLRKRPPG